MSKWCIFWDNEKEIIECDEYEVTDRIIYFRKYIYSNSDKDCVIEVQSVAIINLDRIKKIVKI